MENSKSDRASSSKPTTDDFALWPTTASRLSVHSQSESQFSPTTATRRESTRPPTSSTSGQSGTHPEWAQPGNGRSGSRTTFSSEADDVDVVPTDFWPRSDSEDDSGEGGSGKPLKRTGTAKTAKPSKTARKIKAILQKFGRSYNQRYGFLPNDSQEKDRNVLQHKMLLKMLDGKLYLAPIQNPRRVLDLGCGPGDWPLEFARRHPHSAVLGVDIDKIKPPYQLPNCRFQVTDFTEKWSYDVKFDFIHLRHLGNLPSRDVVASIYEHLRPGGWAEFTEWIVSIQATHNSFSETSFYKWLRYWKLGLSKLGTTVYYPLKYKQRLLDTGFRNVTERKYAFPVNPWPPSRQLKEVGEMMALNINIILEPMSMPIFTEVLGWPAEALRSLLAEVREELADVGIHAFMTLLTVYAQKPRGDESSSASSVRSAEVIA